MVPKAALYCNWVVVVDATVGPKKGPQVIFDHQIANRPSPVGLLQKATGRRLLQTTFGALQCAFTGLACKAVALLCLCISASMHRWHGTM